MTELETKFEELITEMEVLIMKKAPTIINTIIILKNQERNEQTSYYEEKQKKEIELNTLRKTYTKIMDDLMKLDCDKAKLRVKEIIKTKRKLDFNCVRDLKDLNPPVQRSTSILRNKWGWPIP